jgi:hypothetical protein
MIEGILSILSKRQSEAIPQIDNHQSTIINFDYGLGIVHKQHAHLLLAEVRTKPS